LSSGACRYPEKPTEVYDARGVDQTERAIERDDRASGEVDSRCHCSKLPYAHKLHDDDDRKQRESKRREEQRIAVGDDKSDLEREIEYQKSKMWNY